MNYNYQVPEHKKLRLIINTDAKNEADDQFAIVHALLTPKFDIKGIIAAHFGERKSDRSMEDSYDEIEKLLGLMDLQSEVNVVKGAPKAMPGEETSVMSDGAQLIIDEAMKDDSKPLYVIFLGPITDLACAYLQEPKIADKLTAIWIGGGVYPEGDREFNLSNDISAANVILKSAIPLWQVPKNVYRMVKVGIAELEHRIRPHGEIGNYLFEQLAEYNHSPYWRNPWGDSWCLGDSPAVSLLIDDHPFHYEEKDAPLVTEDMCYVSGASNSSRKIRVYNYIDSRFTLEDMFAKIALNYPEKSKTLLNKEVVNSEN
ncbi:nucleoside hydrolase [Aquibacillus albus]|uniref:Inosine-uridine nucleoside N-ribohydrolase n=1 Tax=Aquibacillus albus TaxID=1168171 RepID=A0ABS2MY17_9BACI|nr:nucleoside hydrolase [Aquibacillus albus]MBM7570585.1 inosine-uridine nucleoside N-ribohydrolase [Aquibacillus albus]